MGKLTRTKVLDEIIVAADLREKFLERHGDDEEFDDDELHVLILALDIFEEIAHRWLVRKGEENEQNRNREH